MGVSGARIGPFAFAGLALISIAAFRPSHGRVSARGADADLSAHAQPVSKPLHIILELGEQYESGDELYDAKITVVKV